MSEAVWAYPEMIREPHDKAGARVLIIKKFEPLMEHWKQTKVNDVWDADYKNVC